MPHRCALPSKPIGSPTPGAPLLGVMAAGTLSVCLLLAPGLLDPNVARAAVPAARAARTISLNESGKLHLTSKHGFTLNEQGPASGTVAGHDLRAPADRLDEPRDGRSQHLATRGLDRGRGDGELPQGRCDGELLGLAVDQPRNRQLRRCSRIGPELQRHDPALQRRDRRARERQGLGVTGESPTATPTEASDARAARARQALPGGRRGDGARGRRRVAAGRSPARWSRCTGRAARARRRCC